MNNDEKIIALLPMKGHSERVSGKNFKYFNGKPLFHWVLETLLEIPDITKIVINTDAREKLFEMGLPKIPRIEIRDRKPEICGDFISMNRVIEDDVKNTSGDVYLMTHATNPLLTSKTVKAALSCFKSAKHEDNADSLFTVNRVQTRLYRKDGSPVNHDPKVLIRTQDLEPWFDENSNLYIFTRDSFLSTNARIGNRPILFETPLMESIDIDDQASWELAEAVGKSFQNHKNKF